MENYGSLLIKEAHYFLNLAERGAFEVVDNLNSGMIILSQDQDKLKDLPTWNSLQLGLPLLFCFYHGLELLCKGIVLKNIKDDSDLEEKMKEFSKQHHFSQILKDLKPNNDGQQEFVDSLKRVTSSEVPWSYLFHSQNSTTRTSVDAFDKWYMILKYPFDKDGGQYDRGSLRSVTLFGDPIGEEEDGLETWRCLMKEIKTIRASIKYFRLSE